MSVRASLLHTHPRLGRAAFAARWERDHTGEHPGERFCEVLDMTHEQGRCRHCGAREDRIETTERILVGANRGLVTRHFWMNRTCNHGNGSSNYRRPWEMTA